MKGVQMGSRAIRLKEFELNHDFGTSPPEHYRNVRGGAPEPRSYRIRTDANGFMLSSERTSESKIIGLGDSVLECMFIDEEKRLCAQIEQRLGCSAQVLNGGYSGATSLHMLNAILNKIVPIRPSGIFLMTGIMDIEAMFKKRSFWSEDVYLRPLFEINGDPGVWDQDFRDEMDVVSRLRISASIIDVARNFGIPLSFISTPHFHDYSGAYITQTYTVDDFPKKTLARQRANRSLRDLCQSQSVPFFDVEEDMAHRGDLFYDDIHLNEAGAAFLVECLERSGFFDLMRSWVATPQLPQVER